MLYESLTGRGVGGAVDAGELTVEVGAAYALEDDPSRRQLDREVADPAARISR